MAALTIKFNYVRDYAVLYREDFIKYLGLIILTDDNTIAPTPDSMSRLLQLLNPA